MKKLFSFAAICSMLLCAAPAVQAWDGVVSGKVADIQVTAGNNLGFRVALASAPVMCNGGQAFAYLNESDSNYKVYVSMIMLAKAQGYTVTIYANLEGAQCHIGHLFVGS